MRLIAIISLLLSGQQISGTASQYDKGVMERTVVNQQRYGHLSEEQPAHQGKAAMMSCDMMNNRVWVRPEGGQWELIWITDCSGHASTSSWMIRNNILIEIDYETARRWGIPVGRGSKIEMSLFHPDLPFKHM